MYSSIVRSESNDYYGYDDYYDHGDCNGYSDYAVASTNQAAFFIGGLNAGSLSSVIAKYEDDVWSLHGNLKKRRYGHGSITYGTETIVIGGYTDDRS